MNSYRFMYLEEASLAGPTPHHVKRLQPIRPEIPEQLAIKLDAWDFDQAQDRDRNPLERCDFELIRSKLSQLLNDWLEELRQLENPGNPAWAELKDFKDLLGKVKYRVAPKSQNGRAQRVYLVRNPPDNEGMINLRRPQD